MNAGSTHEQARKFSIFVPVYNGGEYLKSCVASVLGQVYSDLELIILESCSNDGSYEWVQTIEDPRVKICQSSGRLTIEENWSRILTYPKNEYMTILGQDDIFGPNFLQEINKLIEETPQASLFLTHFDIIDSKGFRSSYCKPIPRIEYAHEFLAQRFLKLRDSSATGYVMRSKDYEEVGGIPLYHHLLWSDDALWYSLMKKSFRVTSPKICFSYRSHGQNTSTKLVSGDILKSFRSFISFVKGEMEKDEFLREVVERYFVEHLNNWFEAELYFSRTLARERLADILRDIQEIYSKFSLKCPFEMKQERNPFLKKVIAVGGFCLPNGIYEILKKNFVSPTKR